MTGYRLSYGTSAVGIRLIEDDYTRTNVHFEEVSADKDVVTGSSQAHYWKLLTSVMESLVNVTCSVYCAIEFEI